MFGNIVIGAVPGRSNDQTRIQAAQSALSAETAGSCDPARLEKTSSNDMFTKNSQFPHHTLLANGFESEHLLQVRDGNLGFFRPTPDDAGAPIYGPDRWLTVTGPGANGLLQNFTIHHAALVESDRLNRLSLPAFFHVDALQDVDGFAKKLLDPNDPFSRLIRNRLPGLTAWDGSSPLPRVLASRIVTELNRLIKSPEKLSQVPFVDPPVGSFVEGLASNPNPSRKDRALLVKSLIEDAYPSLLSRHRRLRSAYAQPSAVTFAVTYGVSQFGFNLPFPVLIVCRPNTCSKELAEAITRGEVTDIRIGGDIIGAVLPVPPVVHPDRLDTIINDERVFSLGFGADSGINPPTTLDELNVLSHRLAAEDPIEAGLAASFNPFDTPRELGPKVERRLAVAA